MKTVIAVVACGLLFACAKEEPIAMVGQVPVFGSDAEELRVLIQPAPSVEAARALAVDAAIAHRLLHGSVAGSSAKARLSAYRELVAEVKRKTPEPVALAAELVRILHGGVQVAADPVRERRRLERLNDAQELFELEHTFGQEVRTQTVPLSHLARPLAEAVAGAELGSTVVVDTREGRHQLEVRRRISPRKL